MTDDREGRAGAFFGGAVAGVLSTLLLSRPRIRRGVGDSFRGAGVLLFRAVGLLTPPPAEDVGEYDGDSPDPAAVESAVSGSPLAGRVRARALGRGVVEITGSAEDADAVHDLQETLRGLEGVDFVVNRVWMPGAVRTPAEGG